MLSRVFLRLTTELFKGPLVITWDHVEKESTKIQNKSRWLLLRKSKDLWMKYEYTHIQRTCGKCWNMSQDTIFTPCSHTLNFLIDRNLSGCFRHLVIFCPSFIWRPLHFSVRVIHFYSYFCVICTLVLSFTTRLKVKLPISLTSQALMTWYHVMQLQ